MASTSWASGNMGDREGRGGKEEKGEGKGKGKGKGKGSKGCVEPWNPLGAATPTMHYALCSPGGGDLRKEVHTEIECSTYTTYVHQDQAHLTQPEDTGFLSLRSLLFQHPEISGF